MEFRYIDHSGEYIHSTAATAVEAVCANLEETTHSLCTMWLISLEKKSKGVMDQLIVPSLLTDGKPSIQSRAFKAPKWRSASYFPEMRLPVSTSMFCSEKHLAKSVSECQMYTVQRRACRFPMQVPTHFALRVSVSAFINNL